MLYRQSVGQLRSNMLVNDYNKKAYAKINVRSAVLGAHKAQAKALRLVLLQAKRRLGVPFKHFFIKEHAKPMPQGTNGSIT